MISFALGKEPTIVNDVTGQVALASAPKGPGGFAEPPYKSVGTAPYTKEQVAEGPRFTLRNARSATEPICWAFRRPR